MRFPRKIEGERVYSTCSIQKNTTNQIVYNQNTRKIDGMIGIYEQNVNEEINEERIANRRKELEKVDSGDIRGMMRGW